MIAEYRARIIGAEDVAPIEVIVTPEPCANVVNPAPIDCTLIWSPAEKTLGGTVSVTAEAFEVVTSLFCASVNTNVYVVPVCALNTTGA